MRQALIGLALAITSTAHAEPSPFAERPLSLSAHAGLGTPFGFYGVAVNFAIHPRITLEAGGGQGLVGIQAAAQARARMVRASGGWLSLGLGMSEGHYEQREPFFGIEYAPTVVDRAFWANGDLSYEVRTAEGVEFRVYAGAGVVFAGERVECDDGADGRMPCSGSARGMWTPYAGFSLGYALPL